MTVKGQFITEYTRTRCHPSDFPQPEVSTKSDQSFGIGDFGTHNFRSMTCKGVASHHRCTISPFDAASPLASVRFLDRNRRQARVPRKILCRAAVLKGEKTTVIIDYMLKQPTCNQEKGSNAARDAPPAAKRSPNKTFASKIPNKGHLMKIKMVMRGLIKSCQNIL
ncbi:uncharacterized protein LOC126786813 isoform X2 [Argentina anserina]|nr:uncharacterized protein LOC126786813 isoform X2 [Potentilla anserina]XP_050368717.1 uncharacterized protein LOC126786813 isoform X2 [Potentilla anserina]XP_050368718.1 uncharacterized protein LOC126786813 isoform X2 [Potentilla anserina]XP_050368719.1 uncharacterized protein LOC126786813 isoform X2 [Potentilla anserina]